MLTYQYLTKDGVGKQVMIELLDYAFIRRWIEYLDKISGRCPNINWYIGGLNDSSGRRLPENNVYDLLRLRDCFNLINRNGLADLANEITNLERLMAFPDRVTQHHLNTWHRIFTGLEMQYLKKGATLPNGLVRDDIWQTIQDINTYTHHMELWTYRRMPKRQQFMEYRQHSIQFTNANNLAYLKKENQVFGKNNIEFIEPGGFDFFTQNYNATVWLHEDITGKDQMKAWLDDDDLKEDDITGNLLMTPSVTLDPQRLYIKILENEDFRQQSKASGKTLDRYPLGNIVNLKSIDWKEFTDSSITSVHLFGKKLWPKEAL